MPARSQLRCRKEAIMPSSAPCLTPLFLSFAHPRRMLIHGKSPRKLDETCSADRNWKAGTGRQQLLLYIPGGKTIPLQPAVKGPLVVNSGEATTRIQLTRSLCLYKEWYGRHRRSLRESTGLTLLQPHNRSLTRHPAAGKTGRQEIPARRNFPIQPLSSAKAPRHLALHQAGIERFERHGG